MKSLIVFIFTFLFSMPALAQHEHHEGHEDHDHYSPIAQAPIGVMGDHLHEEGKFMLSYRYSSMTMKGNRKGTDDVSPGDVLADFMVTPLQMHMEMHMLGAMYGVNNEFTIMGMIPYIRKSMDHINAGAVEFETEARGFGDTKLSGIHSIFKSGNDQVLLNAGLSFPTGSITQRDQTPASANAKLPYPMQLGSGTLDPIIGVTYTGYNDLYSWGSQVGTTQRFGLNNEGYRLGSEYTATAWGARKLNENVGFSLRLDGKAWGNIEGQDRDLNVGMVPTARTDLRAGERVDLLAGFTFVHPTFEGYRLALEGGAPVYQRLDGPQLETDYRFMLAVQKQF